MIRYLRQCINYIIITSEITIMVKKNFLSIILPTYNERRNIVPLVKHISKYVKSLPFEIIIVDDDSPDKTAFTVLKNFANDSRVKLFIKKEDKGLAYAISYGLKKAHGEFIIVMDTDFNHNPADLPKLLRLRDKFDMIIGSRYIPGGGMEDKLRYILSYIYNFTIRKILHLTTHDNLSGFFLIHAKHIKKFDSEKIFSGYGDYFIRLLTAAHEQNLLLAEIPVFYQNRRTGQSKSKFLPMFIDYSKTVIDILLKK